MAGPDSLEDVGDYHAAEATSQDAGFCISAGSGHGNHTARLSTHHSPFFVLPTWYSSRHIHEHTARFASSLPIKCWTVDGSFTRGLPVGTGRRLPNVEWLCSLKDKLTPRTRRPVSNESVNKRSSEKIICFVTQALPWDGSRTNPRIR